MLNNQCKQIKNLSLWSKVIFKLEATSAHPKRANDVKISRAKSSGERSAGQQALLVNAPICSASTGPLCSQTPWERWAVCCCLALIWEFCFQFSSFLFLGLCLLRRNSSQSTKNVSMVKFSSPKQKKKRIQDLWFFSL